MGVEAKALRRREDTWELVVEKLVRVGPNYYKPRRQCVRGRDDILQTLDRLNQPALAEDAKRAMEGPAQTYQISRGRLETSADEPASPGTDDETIRQLVRRCGRLESRVEALETALRGSRSSKTRSGTQSASPLSKPGTQAPSQSSSPDASSTSKQDDSRSEPAVAGSDRRRATDEDPQQSSADPQPDAAKPSEDPPSDPAASKEDTPPSENPRLAFPEPSAFSKACADLLGDEFNLSDMPPFALDDGPFYMTDLVDESDEVLGALVLDLRATVFQSGALTMLEEEARQAMFETGEPTADALDAMKEILAAQSRCFNSIPGNPHVRINTLRPPDAEKDAWLFGAEHTVALRDPFEGRMLLASR